MYPLPPELKEQLTEIEKDLKIGRYGNGDGKILMKGHIGGRVSLKKQRNVKKGNRKKHRKK